MLLLGKIFITKNVRLIDVDYKKFFFFLLRECCATNKVWFWMDEAGNPLKIPNLELQLEQDDFDNLK